MLFAENISLKEYNTFHISAAARYFAEFDSVDLLKEILTDKKFKTLPIMILGGGSNILLTKDFEGIILKNNIKGIELIKDDAEHYYVKAGAGENWHNFVMHCIDKGYAGVENLSLIPGNVGAGPMQNIGAYGVELKDVFYELDALHIESKKNEIFSNSACKFGYRESVFKNEAKGKYVITSVTFKLSKKPNFNTSYGAIEEELKKMGVLTPSIKAVSQAVCNIRSSKLPDPKQIGNAGSFFKNPVVSNIKFEKLKAEYPAIVGYKAGEQDTKIAAGWLIEQCGWKGKTFGDAGVHKNQALVLVNYNNANGKEIFDLSEKIITSVKDKFGVELQREVNVV